MKDRVNILGIDIHKVNMEETLKRIELFIKERKKSCSVFTPNVNMITRSIKDEKLKHSLIKADLLVPDGMPLIWVSKILNTPLEEKVEGTDIFFNFCRIASSKNYRIFLMGAKEGIAQKAAIRLKKKFKNLNIIGTYSPLFGFEKDKDESDKMIKMLKDSDADILFMGISEGKGEKWIHKNKDNYKIPVSIQVGASFDIAAGEKKITPVFIKNSGFSWLWRLIQEPRRLWRRYLVHDMKFFYYIVLQIFKKRFGD